MFHPISAAARERARRFAQAVDAHRAFVHGWNQPPMGGRSTDTEAAAPAAPAVPTGPPADPATAVAIGREAFAEGRGAVDAVVEWQLARERLHRRRLAECPPGFYTDGAAATPSSF